MTFFYDVRLHDIPGQRDEDVGRLERERSKLRAAVSELELQLKSMAVSYGQVEQNNAELRAALEAETHAS